ncbi:hypothetical protein E2C00_32835 [Streptomyces sp. WAC05374]|uniref:hypothetical protein n=1 Tax=Streptomyces sp. WAC05374 TaxID=2487420 RepID=UPI000F87C761|nr:hypothetical protein [Streptomyces sp. WAC05374]RST17436.1 hypothetical protein EF905_09445 [Streptomyces sp. WAC05374]TDF36803.1 hypothetical protein E2B92_30485 [Streptomyces sp. WAC05374]TDF46321.1 hypothetical protein E2C02_32465 [Streptomyces sp. WAC05374]TDF46856.1 hypothetical protein E2C00_32835 [Streptomyces sp. WAC05374]
MVFAKAARLFIASTHPRDSVAISVAGEDPSQLLGRRSTRAWELRRQADIKPLQDAFIVVELEGPRRVAELAGQVVSYAHSTLIVIGSVQVMGFRLYVTDDDESVRFPDLRSAHAALVAAVQAFMTAARDHLNGSSR